MATTRTTGHPQDPAPRRSSRRVRPESVVARPEGAPISILRLVNGSAGDPCLYVDFPGQGNAVLFDMGNLAALSAVELADVGVLCLSHFHLDHVADFERLLRHTLDRDRTIDVLGPPTTCDRLHARLASLQIQRFPFQRLTLRVHEIDAAGRITVSEMACQRNWKRTPQPARTLAKDRVALETPEARIRVAFGSHTVPDVLAFALDTKRAYRFDSTKAEAGLLRAGPWIRDVLEALKQPKAKRPTTITIGAVEWPLDALARDYFTLEPATRVAYVTDTCKAPETWNGLLDLVAGAARLYADAYYLHADLAQAEKHGHLTATQAGELAAQAGAGELWLMHAAPKLRGRYEQLEAEARQAHPHVHALWPIR